MNAAVDDEVAEAVAEAGRERLREARLVPGRWPEARGLTMRVPARAAHPSEPQ